ncbi:MAG: hypothetical protein KF716_15080 [Anaerolineae bacterium]|nr:hypothetical protein [Anaerolineae bacterium]
MRQTAKFKAAQALIRKLYQNDPKKLRSFLTMDHETLYESLHDDFYVWEPKRDQWVQLSEEEREFSGGFASRYIDRDGQPSGIFDLRIIGHPQDVEQIAALLRKFINIGRLTDPYPRRHGDGVMFYVTARLPEPKGKKRS